MTNTDALLMIAAAATPPTLSYFGSGSLTGADDARRLALIAFALSGAFYLATGSSAAGAIATGAGASAAFMYGTQAATRQLPAAT